MPYSKSKSRVNFEENLKRLRSLARTASYKKSGFSYDHKNLICQSSIFLACASIEEYLKIFIEDLLYEFNHNSANVSELPDNFRALKLLLSQQHIFKNYVFNGDEPKSLKAINKAWDKYEIIHDNKEVSKHIHPQDIIGTKKYPSVKNLKILYNRFGIKDIFKAVQLRAKKDYKPSLESFLSIREAISHQAAPQVTYEDVKRNFENIQGLVNHLDRIKYSHFCKISGEKYWPN